MSSLHNIVQEDDRNIDYFNGFDENLLEEIETITKGFVDLSYRQLDSGTLELHLQRNAGNSPNAISNRVDNNNSGTEPHLTFDAKIHSLFLQNNNLNFLPANISEYTQLKVLDLSYNNLARIPSSILSLTQLTSLIIKSNRLDNDSLPARFGNFQKLETLNLGGNLFTRIPPQVFNISSLKSLYLGGNEIEEISRDIAQLCNLETLYLGGNHLEEIPGEMGGLGNLRTLVLSYNRLTTLPSTLSGLVSLRSLSLQGNLLTTLPMEMEELRDLSELCLRDNPLSNKHFTENQKDPPSLLEMTARVAKVFDLPYTPKDLPLSLRRLLQNPHPCASSQCQGIYFSSRVFHIRHADLCGNHKVPLQGYICSHDCCSKISHV